MKETDLKEFHHRLCILMNEIHKICVENGIRYTLLGGSLIGAVRHHGFIPWDDDMDIGMPWRDYKRFCEIVSNIKHEWVEFDNPFDTSCSHLFPKAYDKRTTLRENATKKHEVRGIYIDIFPMSYVGNRKKKAMIEFRWHQLLNALYLRKQYFYPKNSIQEILYSIVGLFFSTNVIRKLINHQLIRLGDIKTYYISDLDGTTRGIVPSTYFERFKLFDFDGFQFYGVEEADEYLKCVWGDYMQLPPVEKRKPGHFEYLNLNLPYKDYIKGIE